jgi:hypothetical protein
VQVFGVAASELGPEVAEQLSELGSADHMSVLLGAGASVAAGLPGWDELAIRLLEQAGAIDDAATARAYMASQDATLAAEAARAVCEDWAAVVRRALYGDSPDLYPRALHLAVAALAATDVRDVSLLTLNLDDLLEEALGDALFDLERPERVVSRTGAVPRAKAGQLEIQHLHGLLPRDPQTPASGLVLTLSDFNALSARAHPWQAAALSEAMSQGPLVLVGTSFRDPDIRQWIHAIREQIDEQGASVIAVVAREALGLSRAQFVAVAEAVRQQWASVGVTALLVQDHVDAAQVIRELPECASAGYRLPRDRASDLFQTQLADFHARQLGHSEALDSDRRDLPSGRDSDSDLTLWLSDGTDALVRWTSHDRVYRSPEKLRRIPLGHDSPWTASQAVSQSEVVVHQPPELRRDLRRWRTVIASPITASLAGGPNLVVGAVTAGTTAALDSQGEQEWRAALADLGEVWGERLTAS